MRLWAIYIFPQSIRLFCCRKICGPILGIHKSLSDTWGWTEAAQFPGVPWCPFNLPRNEIRTLNRKTRVRGTANNAPEMEITKNKSIGLATDFLKIFKSISYGMDFFLEFTNIGKSLKTFGSRIFFLIFLKSIGWYGFSYGFLVVLTFEYVLSLFSLKVLLILYFTNIVLSKPTFRSTFVS